MRQLLSLLTVAVLAAFASIALAGPAEPPPGPERDELVQVTTELIRLYRQGRFAEARPLAERRLVLAEKLLGGEHPQVGSSCEYLGVIQRNLGDYAAADVSLKRGLAIYEKAFGPEAPETAPAVQNLADLYLSLGDFDTALPLYRRGLTIAQARHGEAAPQTGQAWMALGYSLFSAGRAEAEEPLLKALSIFEAAFPVADHFSTAEPCSYLGQLYRRTGNHHLAVRMLERALSVREKHLGPNHPLVGVTLNDLASAVQGSGDYDRAEPLYRRSIEVYRKTLGPRHPSINTIQVNLASLAIDRNMLDEARRLSRDLVSSELVLLENVLSFTSEEQRLAYMRTTNPYSLPASLGDAVSMASMVLRYKGVVLDSLLEDIRIASRGQPQKVAHWRQLRSKLNEAAYREPSPETERIRAELADIERQLAKGGRRSALRVTPAQVQARLGPHDVLIEYVRFDFYGGQNRWQPRFGAVILPARGAPRWVDLGDATAIEERVKAYQAMVRRRTANDRMLAILRDSYDRILGPVVAQLPGGTRRLIFSPDGALHLVSMATLLTPTDRFVAQEWDVRYITSGRDLLAPKPRRQGGPAVLLGAPNYKAERPVSALRGTIPRQLLGLSFAPLPGTEREVKALAALCRQHRLAVRLNLQDRASEATVRQTTACSVLHLATHGFFVPAGGTPMQRSGLALSGAGRTVEAWRRNEQPDASDDGILTAAEVASLKLDGTWLATLSACETGLGEVRQNEGVLGLRRGFVQAGVGHLGMSLWPVDDAETARFMELFYSAALRSGRPGHSLASVQRQRLVSLRTSRGLWEAVSLAGPFVLTSVGTP